MRCCTGKCQIHNVYIVVMFSQGGGVYIVKNYISIGCACGMEVWGSVFSTDSTLSSKSS